MDALPVGATAPRPYPQRLVGRTTTSGVLQTLSVRQGGIAGVFLDPPYSDEVRQGGLYAVDSGTVANDVRAWCEANGDNPRYRIVLAGYDTEHAALEARGWRAVEWFRGGFLKGGMGNEQGQWTPAAPRAAVALPTVSARRKRRRRWRCLERQDDHPVSPSARASTLTPRQSAECLRHEAARLEETARIKRLLADKIATARSAVGSDARALQPKPKETPHESA